MSDAVAIRRYSIAANLRWFTVALVIISLPLAIVGFVVGRFGSTFELPQAVAYGFFALAAAIAGRRFAYKSAGQWSHRDRVALAIGYSLIDIVLTSALVAFVVATAPWAQHLSYDQLWPLLLQGTATKLVAEVVLSFVILTLLAFAMEPEFKRQAS